MGTEPKSRVQKYKGRMNCSFRERWGDLHAKVPRRKINEDDKGWEKVSIL